MVTEVTRLLKKEKLWKIIWKHNHSKTCQRLPERNFRREQLAALWKFECQMLIVEAVIQNGTLNLLYTCNQFTTCTEGTVYISDVSSINVSLRDRATKASLFGGQRYKRRNCKILCRNNFCLCSKSNKLLNSKCHNSLSCENKWHLCWDTP